MSQARRTPLFARSARLLTIALVPRSPRLAHKAPVIQALVLELSTTNLVGGCLNIHYFISDLWSAFLMLIAFTKNCIVSSVRLQFSHYFYRDPENISLARDLATVLFQLLTMVDYQRKFNETAKKSTLQFVNLPSYMMLTMMCQKRSNVESRRFTDVFLQGYTNL